MEDKIVVLLLGSNMGDSLACLKTAIHHIENRLSPIIMASSLYKTAAWGKVNQADFYNQVVAIKSSLTPEEILTITLDIEMQMGRERIEKWAERVIDIDILFYGNDIIDNPNLKVPHPYLHVRRFTLIPLQEILPQFVHPVFNKTIDTLLDNCSDIGKVEKL
ncbi:MAG: 2-amino-4-hydroxy-6-hydroxymethyldihydropteridine diphosphokinase [Bacteroidetes bacterium]|jgi:2-amino-4-hydroxy-6-hydroxymethyldihydropteridine diphosphokinase|nr:2-amino-4-hydroxy-6-hydroxymethyldihydropteridine diphosphokinase [Bacteroidota bacterium]